MTCPQHSCSYSGRYSSAKYQEMDLVIARGDEMSNSLAPPTVAQPTPAQPTPGSPPPTPPPGQHDAIWARVQQTRAWAGLLVIFVGAAAITGVALWGLTKANSTNTSSIVAILTTAFTAIATMITAYFGIRAVTNTAQSAVGDRPGGNPPGGNSPDGNPPGGNLPGGNKQ